MTWFLWACLAALFAGLTAILAKVGVRGVDADLATAIRTTVVLILAWGIVAARGRLALGSVPPRTWVWLILSGGATGASWLCYFRALQQGQASQVAPIDKLSVVVALVLAWLVLGEPLTVRHLVGGALIVAGVLILART